MSKTNSIVQTFRNYSSYILWLVGVLTIFANLWVASQLAPISERVSLNTRNVQAAIDDISDIKIDTKELANKKDIDKLELRLERIENILLQR